MGMYRGNTMPVDSSARVSWVIPPHIRAALAAAAQQDHRTVSAEARYLLEEALRNRGFNPDDYKD